MIKINLHNEKHILDFHYNKLTVKVGRFQNVLNRLVKRQKMAVISGNVDLSRMYTFLLNRVTKNGVSGFSILTAKPTDLDLFKEEFISLYSALLCPDVRKQLKQIFYYKSYINDNGYHLASLIDLKVCPYCNRSYTFTVGNDSKKGTRFEYDHFFLRAKYPFLGLSFFNLIPSCHICNSNLKRKKEFNLTTNIHPYIEGFGNDIVFSIKPNDVDFINGKASSYRLKFKKGAASIWSDEKVRAAVNNIFTFQLSTLYNIHKDYIDEIIQKSIVYNTEYVNSLYEQFAGTLFRNKEDVYRMILSNYISEENYSKRVLAKLTTDISKELDLLV